MRSKRTPCVQDRGKISWWPWESLQGLPTVAEALVYIEKEPMLHIPTIAAVLGLSACAVGQSFSYTSFANTPELNKLGSCVTSPGGSSLVLTDGPGQTGWVWHTAPVDVQRGFDTTFEQRIALTPSTALGCGFAFVIHGDPDGSATMGGGAWGLGYGQGSTNATGIRRSLAIEFDVFRDAFIGDVYHQEISVHTRGPAGNSANEQWAIARVDAPILLSTLTRPIRIRYVPGTLEIYHTNLSTPILSVAYDFTQGGTYLNGTPAPGIALGNDFAYVGFSAATRASSPTLAQIVRINSWTWSGKDCASGTLANNMLTINGSAGGVGRRVEIAPLQAFSLEVGNPSSAASSSPYVLFASLQPQPNAPGTIVGPVRTCFPVLPMGPNEFVLADSFGFFAGSAPAPTTPHAFLFPFGVYNPFPSLTLQAVTLDVHTLQIEVSNAIELAQPPTPTVTTPQSQPHR